MSGLLQPEEISVTTMDGDVKSYIISRLPATVAREVVTQYPVSAVPKIGDYGRNEELMFKLMKYVAVPGIGANGSDLRLINQALIDNHVPDFETLIRLEMAMLEKNCSFFAKGKASNFLASLVDKVQALITSTLTDSLRSLSKKD
jgi:hypothetical protein